MQWGGEIDAFSQVNVGTEFTVYLPLNVIYDEYEPKENIENQCDQQQPKIERLKILIAEDNRVNALVLKKMCESDGHTVVCVDDGYDAIEALKTNTYHLILMDNHMPRLGGVEAIKIIRQEMKLSTCIFACTADAFKEVHEDFLNAGANFVLTKPLKFSCFKEALVHNQELIMSEATTSNNHQASVLRLPSTSLSLAEEELSQSPLLNGDLDETQKQSILKNFIEDIDQNIDLIINGVTIQSSHDVFSALHSIEGVALELGLQQVAALSAVSEATEKSGIVPSCHKLQQLVNLLLANVHQAEDMLSSKENDKIQKGINDKDK